MTPADFPSNPVSSSDVQRLIRELINHSLDGLTVQVTPAAAISTEDASEESVVEAIRRVRNIAGSGTVFHNFALAHLAGMIEGDDRAVARFLAQTVGGSASTWYSLRWVGARWPPELRAEWIDKIRSWSFFRVTAALGDDEKRELARLFSKGKITCDQIETRKCNMGPFGREFSQLLKALDRATRATQGKSPDFSLQDIVEAINEHLAHVVSNDTCSRTKRVKVRSKAPKRVHAHQG